MENLENDVIEDVSDDTETIEETSQEEVTYEDYLALKERNRKAEAKLVEMKKKEKEIVKEKPVSTDAEIRLFLLENPEAKEFKDQILELKTNPKTAEIKYKIDEVLKQPFQNSIMIFLKKSMYFCINLINNMA